MRKFYRQHSHLLGSCVAGLIIISLAGCSTATPDEDWYAIANGVDADIGGVEVRSLLLVSEDANEPGRFLGTLFNTSTSPVDVVFSDANDSVTVRVESQGQLGFDTRPLLFSSVSEIPGSRVPVVVTVGSEQKELSTPVFDGTLQAYRPFLPTVSPSTSSGDN
jgi:hypothetical protein